MPDLKPFNQDSSMPPAFHALVYALKTRYGVNKKYVTSESTSSRLLNFLAAGYKIHSATYRDLSEAPQEEGQGPAIKTLVILDPRLDAFCLELPQCPYSTLIFFDDLAELQKLHTTDTTEVPFGAYMLQETMAGYGLIPMKVKEVERPILEPGVMESLVSDTDTFFSSEDFYKANKLSHKRGILILGAPGTGKSTFIKYYLGHIREVFGVIIDCSAIYFGASLFHYLKSMFRTKPKVLVLEDVDGVASSGGRSAFLNFLDGPNELTNCLVIATTNYPERLDPAMLDRPSRFDSIIYIGTPGPELRKQFLLKWFPELSSDESRLSTLVDGTDGFTGAYFTELKAITGLRRCTAEKALEFLNQRRELLKSVGANHKPMALYDNPPEGMAMEASLLANYQVDIDMAKKIIGEKK